MLKVVTPVGDLNTLTVTGKAFFSDGTDSQPSITNIGDTNTGIYFPSADTCSVTTAGAEALRVNASGNVGIGKVPNDWISAYRALQVGSLSSLYGRNDLAVDGAFVINGYRSPDANWKYIVSDIALRYALDADGHKWSVANSGTAGNDISFNLKMTLSFDGNLSLAAGSTGMTNGFFYIPAAGGAPSGTPAAITGTVPMYYDTAGNNFYIYNGGWKKVNLS